MSAGPTFRIEIIPALPDVAPGAPGRDYAASRREVLARTNAWRQLIYRVGPEMYAYYPTDIVTLLLDLQAEASAFAAARSHGVELSGRRVCYAVCREGRVWFVAPHQADVAEAELQMDGAGVPLSELCAAFDAAAAQVRGHLDQILAEPS